MRLELRAWDLGFKVGGLETGVLGLKWYIVGLVFRVHGLGLTLGLTESAKNAVFV